MYVILKAVTIIALSLSLYKPWWRSFLKKTRSNIDTTKWQRLDRGDHIDRILNSEEVLIDKGTSMLTFKSEAHFTWFLLKWS